MKRLLAIAAASLAVCHAVHADTSYLLIQGPFGSGSTEETFKYQVSYPTGWLASGQVTGQSLLNAILGIPEPNGSYTDAYSASWPNYTSAEGNNAGEYITFSSVGGFLTVSFTINEATVAQDPSYDPGWDYYVAGGTGNNALGTNDPGPYPNNGDWTVSNDGQSSRQIANGSFDGWVFGATGVNEEPLSTISGADNAPVASNFESAPVTSAPEPGTLALLLVGAGGVWTMTRKRR